MKTFTYPWDDEIFLLHIQLDLAGESKEYGYTLFRNFSGGETRVEQARVKAGQDSYRFMLSRTHPREIALVIEYPANVTLEAFKLEDRAFYPVESFFRG